MFLPVLSCLKINKMIIISATDSIGWVVSKRRELSSQHYPDNYSTFAVTVYSEGDLLCAVRSSRTALGLQVFEYKPHTLTNDNVSLTPVCLRPARKALFSQVSFENYERYTLAEYMMKYS